MHTACVQKVFSITGVEGEQPEIVSVTCRHHQRATGRVTPVQGEGGLTGRREPQAGPTGQQG